MSETPLNPEDRLVDVVRAIEASRRRIAVVVDSAGKLLGTLTDGDVRRCLLAGGTLATPAVEAMTRTPLVAEPATSDLEVLERMKRGNVMTVPRVDADGRFVTLLHVTELDPEAPADRHASGFAAAVIMAGGLGRRLRPITDHVPKPMVEIGGVPLLERLVRRLARAGVSRILISVNYLSHLIENHLGDGVRLGVEIEYLRETQPMGTAGALSLMSKPVDGPVMVMNGDIVTTSDFGHLHDFHCAQEADMTVAAVEYVVDIPYGVLRADGGWFRGLEEKPSQRFLCNAGIYALSPRVIEDIPQRFFNMTDLLKLQSEKESRVAVFPIHEYWSDIGTLDDLETARAAFRGIDDA
ncbi:nucleotidyltransferase family protein [Algihabitans albus]|uniref:nucleotidyltransferase family protein n=1 Tax=Algihabitans albus TaxID=2164067 RepID=UPI0013C2A8E9|nr:nucleotidyltransferase family protein [Algihabitans albus]